MNTIAYRAPRISRAKALIGALLATLAIAGVAQATAPDSAGAMPRSCDGYLTAGHAAEARGDQALADTWYYLYWSCIR